MNHLSICSDNFHERDPLDNFCITCHIQVVDICISNFKDYSIESSELYQLGLKDEALNCLEMGIQINFSLEDTCNKIGNTPKNIKGDALKRLNIEKEATYHYKKGHIFIKNNIKLLGAKSQILQRQKRFEEALICEQQIEGISKNELQERKGILFQFLKRDEEALQEYNQILKYKSKGQENIFLNKGKLLHDQKKYDEALLCFDAALEIDPQLAFALNNKGNTLLKLNKLEEALKCYDAALNINPKSPDFLLNKGNTLQQLHKYEEALKLFDAALKICANNQNNQRNQSCKIYQENYYQNKIKPKRLRNTKIFKYNKTLRHSNLYNYLLGSVLRKLNKHDEALQCYDAALNIDPQSPGILNNKGNVLQEQRKYVESIKFFDAALKLNPQHAQALSNKGISLYELHNYEEALKLQNASLSVDPQSAETLNSKGNTLIGLHKYELSQQCFDAALKINPKFLGALNNKGIILQNQNKYEEALKLYETILEIDPQLGEALCNKGNCLFELHKYEEALKCCYAALSINPKSSKILSNLGTTLQKLHKCEDAVKCYDASLRIDPQVAKTLNDKEGNTLQLMHKNKEAFDCYDAALNIDPEYTIAIYNKGNLLLKLNNYEEALKCYEAALNFSPDDLTITIIIKKAQVLYKIGKHNESLKSLEQALKINPDCIEAQKGRDEVLKVINQQKIKENHTAIKTSLGQSEIQHDLNQEELTNQGTLLLNLNILQQANQFQESLNILDKLLVENKSPEISKIYSNEFQEPLKAFEKIAPIENLIKDSILQNQTQENSLNQQITLGKILLVNYYFKEALDQFEKILQVDQLPEIVYYKAQALLNLKRYEKALNVCEILSSLGGYENQIKELIQAINGEMKNYKQ